MNAIDLTPLYRNSIGFDRLASFFDNTLARDNVSATYPPYNIEVLEPDRYAITLAVAGFIEREIDIVVEKSVLKISGRKIKEETRNYLHQGIATRSFERKFSLADYVEVKNATLNNGLLSIELVRDIPEAMKPRTITINQGKQALEQSSVDSDSKVQDTNDQKVA